MEILVKKNVKKLINGNRITCAESWQTTRKIDITNNIFVAQCGHVTAPLNRYLLVMFGL